MPRKGSTYRKESAATYRKESAGAAGGGFDMDDEPLMENVLENSLTG